MKKKISVEEKLLAAMERFPPDAVTSAGYVLTLATLWSVFPDEFKKIFWERSPEMAEIADTALRALEGAEAE